MATQAGLGQKALEAKDYTAAVKHLTDALKQSNSPLWLIQRSTAHQRLSEYDLSLEDAENAVFAAQSRARRELIATAQFRRAIALHGLKRYGDSRLCFTWVRKLNEKEKGLGMWQAKVAKEYDALPEDAPERVVSIKETPSKRLPKPEEPTKKNTAVVAEDITRATTNTVAPPQTPKEKIRHEWFQSGSKVTITIFAKNVPKDKVEVEISTQALDLRFPTAADSTYDFTLQPLYAQVDIPQSTYSVTPNKIEISLHKAKSGLKWSSLEGTEIIADATASTEPALPTQNIVSPVPVTKAPLYPTSSRNGPKDWDAVAKEALHAENKKASDKKVEEDSIDGEDDDDEMGGDPANAFFAKLYKNADPDTKRAMMKSFQESNGTTLSTDWKDVGSRTIETNPPEGVQAKKWGA